MIEQLPPPPPAPAPAPPVVWPVFVGFILAFSVSAVLSGVLMVIAVGIRVAQQGQGALADPQKLMLELLLQPWVLVTSVALSCTSLGVAAVVGARLSGLPIRERLRLGAGTPLVHTALLLLLVLCVGQLSSSLAWHTGAYQKSILAQISEAARVMPVPWFVLLLIFGCAGAGLGEELFFRGFMQTRLRERYGAWLAIAATAAAFGLIHADPLHTPIAFLMGLVLGWGAELGGNIRPAIAAHVLNNLTSFLMSRFAPDTDEALGPLAMGVLVLIGVAAVVGLKARTRTPPPR